MDPDKPQKVDIDVRNILGTGSFGYVYQGKLKATGQNVAVKMVQKEGQYKRKIDILKSFQELKHQNLVRLLDYEDFKKVLVIIMEFCPFSDFSKYLNHRKVTMENDLHEWEIKDILLQLIQGYNVLYRAKVIHRDLKPKNILLCPRGIPPPTGYPDRFEKMVLKIADFGLSRFLDEEGNASTEAGTPLYRAPEVGEGSYDYKADLWSLGIIILECLIGPKMLLENFNIKTHGDIYLLFTPQLRLMISKDLNNLLTKLLEKSPSERIDFEQLLRHEFLSLPPESLEKLNNEEFYIHTAQTELDEIFDRIENKIKAEIAARRLKK